MFICFCLSPFDCVCRWLRKISTIKTKCAFERMCVYVYVFAYIYVSERCMYAFICVCMCVCVCVSLSVYRSILECLYM